MESSIFIHTLMASFLIIIQFSTQTNSTTPDNTNIEYIKTSCNRTLYPKLCYNSLSVYANEIKNNRKTLANVALNVTLRATKSSSKLIKTLSVTRGLKPGEVAALRDCNDEVGDSVYELKRSIGEMGHASPGPNFDFHMSNVQTWVSAALTNDETCLDGFDEQKIVSGNISRIVRTKISRISRLTSNALAFINCYASSHGV